MAEAQVVLTEQRAARNLRLMEAGRPMGICFWKATYEKGIMSAQPKTESAAAKIPAEINTKLRSLAHDLSNSVETIMQASYLLAQLSLDENAKKWADLIDKASRDCAKINRDIRDILKASA
jgi:signal transduction histidine kinase